ESSPPAPGGSASPMALAKPAMALVTSARCVVTKPTEAAKPALAAAMAACEPASWNWFHASVARRWKIAIAASATSGGTTLAVARGHGWGMNRSDSGAVGPKRLTWRMREAIASGSASAMATPRTESWFAMRCRIRCITGSQVHDAVADQVDVEGALGGRDVAVPGQRQVGRLKDDRRVGRPQGGDGARDDVVGTGQERPSGLVLAEPLRAAVVELVEDVDDVLGDDLGRQRERGDGAPAIEVGRVVGRGGAPDRQRVVRHDERPVLRHLEHDRLRALADVGGREGHLARERALD